jgi:alcohol dehydrogenase class IV
MITKVDRQLKHTFFYHHIYKHFCVCVGVGVGGGSSLDTCKITGGNIRKIYY